MMIWKFTSMPIFDREKFVLSIEMEKDSGISNVSNVNFLILIFVNCFRNVSKRRRKATFARIWENSIYDGTGNKENIFLGLNLGESMLYILRLWETWQIYVRSDGFKFCKLAII